MRERVSDLMGVMQTLSDRLMCSVDIEGILPTRVDRRSSRMMDKVLSTLQELYGRQLCDIQIPVSSALARAQMEGVSIFEFAPTSSGALAYRQLASVLCNRWCGET